MTVVIFQHAPDEGPGRILTAVERAGLRHHTVHTYDGQRPVRPLEDARALIVLGGPMGVADTKAHPFLRDELRAIDLALRAGVPVLGICLGSQLLARVLGARVRPAARLEIGFLPVDNRQEDLLAGLPTQFEPLHWHGDVFELPLGARALASSALTEHQAFAADGAWGVLFHLEPPPAQLRAMVASCAGELEDAGVDGEALTREGEARAAAQDTLAAALFDAFMGRCVRSSPASDGAARGDAP